MEFIDFHTHRPTAEGVFSPRSFGIHPWYAANETAATYAEFADRHRESFADAQIIGECGLDKACRVPLDIQARLFEWQIMMAAELHKPMVVHCVRAFNELMALRRNHPGDNWIVHGFTGPPQLADQLFRQHILVSFGAAILDPRRVRVRETLRRIPHPFLLETDDSPCGIEKIYNEAAQIRKTSIGQLAETIKQTFATLMNR